MVYVNEINAAYDSFIKTLSMLYEKNCKLISFAKREANKPWITKELRNACKKKNYLYKCYLKSRTRESEDRYKKFKDKLVEIMKKHKMNIMVNCSIKTEMILELPGE